MININSSDEYNKFETLLKKKDDILVLYFGNWCGFCREFIPTWDKFIKQSKIKTAQIESSFMHLMNNNPIHKVNGYPTIKLFSKGKMIPFENDRTIENLNTFISKNVKMVPKKNIPKKTISKKTTPKKTVKKTPKKTTPKK
jgi:thiol-disulfide isomerase/thioredoxin